MDDYRIEPKKQWKKVPANVACSSYNVSKDQAKRIVRVSAGMRLRDFTEAMFAQGWALPVAGSTDVQSIGGLIASDLHSTGHTAGFLSQQLLEVLVLDANGKKHRFVKNEKTDFDDDERWAWFILPNSKHMTYSKLPVAGALGMTGVVVEAVIKLDPAFNFEKDEQFVPRKWAERNIEKLLDPQTAPHYHHVSFYYAGGNGPEIKTVRLNTWKRTDKTPPKNALRIKRQRELDDHVGTAFLPNFLLKLSNKTAPIPGSGKKGHPLIHDFNSRDKQILQANHAFARKLYFQHDEIEVGIPLAQPGQSPKYDIFRSAIYETQKLLQTEEFKTVIEIRFTPHASEAMLGPARAGRLVISSWRHR